MKKDAFKVRRGDIFYIMPRNTPVVGSEQRPGRPGIVVSEDTINDCLETVEVVYTTTRIKPEHRTHTVVESTLYESTVLCEQVTTVSIERLGDRCGHCTDDEMRRIDRCLKASLGFDNAELLEAQMQRDMYKKMYEITLQRLSEVNVNKAIWNQ